RAEWGLGQRPVKNMVHLLERHGVRVLSLAEEGKELDAFAFWLEGHPYIFLNTMKTAERSRMDAAHELGHLVMHWREGIAHGPTLEREAESFASAFLMPRADVQAEAPRRADLDRLVAAKKRWKVSVSALAVRMKKLGLLTGYQYRSVFIELAKRGYGRTDEP